MCRLSWNPAEKPPPDLHTESWDAIKLAAFRRYLGLSQYSMAKLIGSRSHDGRSIAEYESGRQNIGIQVQHLLTLLAKLSRFDYCLNEELPSEPATIWKRKRR